MIDDQKAEEAVEFFGDNAGLIGRLRGQKDYLEHRIKVEESLQFLATPREWTVAERNHAAKCHDQVLALIEEKENVIAELETLLTRAKGHELTVSVYQTQSANLRRGNI